MHLRYIFAMYFRAWRKKSGDLSWYLGSLLPEIPLWYNYYSSGGDSEFLPVCHGIYSDLSVGRDNVMLVYDGLLDFAVAAHLHVVHYHGFVNSRPASDHHVAGED